MRFLLVNHNLLCVFSCQILTSPLCLLRIKHLFSIKSLPTENKKEQIQLYDLVCDCHKSKKIPADIEEYILENDEAKEKIRKLIAESKQREVR